MKHTSTVLEPSIPFLPLVKLVDAEDIANDKIRTHDLALKLNKLQINYKLNRLTLHNKNNFCLHNLETQITTKNLHIKSIVRSVIAQTPLSLPVSKTTR